MATVLFVDDEESLRRAVRLALGRRGHVVRTAGTLARAIRCLRDYDFDGIFADVWLGVESGFDLVSWLENHQPHLAKRVVFVSGDVSFSARLPKAVRALGLPVIGKPFEISALEMYALAWERLSLRARGDAHP